MTTATFAAGFLGPFAEPFMQRALVIAVICGTVCGVIGCYVVLRGMAFIGDAVSHAVFPGVATAFVLRVDLVLGGAIAGLSTAVAVALFSQNRRLKEDTIIGVFFAFAFGLGIVILSTAPGYSGSLESFLFGSILGISDRDVRTAALIGAGVLGAVAVLHRPLVAATLDRETARAAGLPVLWLDLALYAMVTASIVLALQAVGNILVLALLITPAATARLLTDRLEVMMVLAPVIGAASAAAGLWASAALDVAAGGMIVIVATGVFVVAFLAAPRHGVLRRRRRQRHDGGVATPRAHAGLACGRSPRRARGAYPGCPNPLSASRSASWVFSTTRSPSSPVRRAVLAVRRLSCLPRRARRS